MSQLFTRAAALRWEAARAERLARAARWKTISTRAEWFTLAGMIGLLVALAIVNSYK